MADSNQMTNGEQTMSGSYTRNADGSLTQSIPEPFYWGLLPWLWRRLIGWRDAFGRPAHFVGWRG